MRTLMIAAALLSLAMPAWSHSPVMDLSPKPFEHPFEVTRPEHSVALFARLSGAADYYRITSTKDFAFYVGITAPKVNGCPLKTVFSFDILDANGKRIDGRAADSKIWAAWYEEYGKTWYWFGPEIGSDFKSTRIYPAGVYYVKVFNKMNRGRYVLAVGDQERFGLKTLLTIGGTMREVRKTFWESGCD